MLAVVANRVHPVLVLLAFAALIGLVACDAAAVGGVASTPIPDRALVTLLKPESGATVGPDLRVPVYALARSSRGITRIQVRVDDTIVDDTSLLIAMQQFDYQHVVTLRGPGQHAITVIAVDAAGQPSDPVSVFVNAAGSLPTAARTATGAATPTPLVIHRTPTEMPATTASSTPYVVYWTATAEPSATVMSKPTVTHTPFVVYWTATPEPSVTWTPTRYVIYVTATPDR